MVGGNEKEKPAGLGNHAGGRKMIQCLSGDRGCGSDGRVLAVVVVRKKSGKSRTAPFYNTNFNDYYGIFCYIYRYR